MAWPSRSIAAARTWPGATTASTIPACSASRAGYWVPLAIHSMAVSAPARRDSRTVPPQPGKIPSLVSGTPTRVSSASTR